MTAKHLLIEKKRDFGHNSIDSGELKIGKPKMTLILISDGELDKNVI